MTQRLKEINKKDTYPHGNINPKPAFIAGTPLYPDRDHVKKQSLALNITMHEYTIIHTHYMSISRPGRPR